MTTRRARVTRRIRSGGYLLLSLSGGLLPLITWLIWDDLRAPWLWALMGGMLAVGGFLSFLGAIMNRWPGEYVGLPMVGPSLFCFGFMQAAQSNWDLMVAPSVGLLWGVSVLVGARWTDVDTLHRAAVHDKKRRRERGAK